VLKISQDNIAVEGSDDEDTAQHTGKFLLLFLLPSPPIAQRNCFLNSQFIVRGFGITFRNSWKPLGLLNVMTLLVCLA